MDYFGINPYATLNRAYGGYYGNSSVRSTPKDLTIFDSDSEAEKRFKSAINDINNGRAIGTGESAKRSDAKTIVDAYNVLSSAMNRYGLYGVGVRGGYGSYGYNSRSAYANLANYTSMNSNAFSMLRNASAIGALSALNGYSAFGW